MSTEEYIKAMSTNNLAVEVQKLAKNISYRDRWWRSKLLNEAADRLVAYRQAERTAVDRVVDDDGDEPVPRREPSGIWGPSQ